MRNVKLISAALGIVASFSLLACGSKDDPAAPACANKFDYSSYSTTAAPTIADIDGILQTSCALPTCHGATATATNKEAPFLGNIGKASDAATQMKIKMGLVGVASGDSDLKYVVANDPANSWLMRKIEGTHTAACGNTCKGDTKAGPCGESMPNGGELLASGDIEKVRAWIKSGAN